MKKCILILLLFLYKVLNYLLTFSLLIIIIISTYALYDSYQIYESVKIEEYLEEVIEEDNSLDKLIKINKDIIGWIKIDDTSINYPVLKSNDNKEYLNKNYKGEYSFSGSLFLDYRNNNFKDEYSIIYGHNLYRGGMLSDISKYKKKKYFNKHLNGVLITKDITYKMKVISYGIFNSNDDYVYNTKKYNIKYIYNKSIIKNKYNKTKYLLLSTCKSAHNPSRLVLLIELKSSS